MAKGQQNRLNLQGQRFSRLTVICFSHKTDKNAAMWICKCDCGTIKTLQTSTLRGGTKSCGCLAKEINLKKNTKHGLAGTRFYIIWSTMMARCYNKKAHAYERYGERGIKVCKQWHNVKNFVAWCEMKNPEPRLTLDRYPNNDGDYRPSNCRFATYSEQNNNRRPRHLWKDRIGKQN